MLGAWLQVRRGEATRTVLRFAYLFLVITSNYVVTTREAKRLFGVIGSGAISGWIVGGLLTRATAVRLGSESLLLLTSGALAICPLIVLAVWRERHVDESNGAVRREDGRGLADSFDLVRRSPHLRAVAILIILSSLVTTVVAWQFKAISKASVGLRSTNASVHAVAVEFLEHSLPSPMRALLLPLIDDEASVEDRIAIADRLVGAPPETPEDARAAMAASEQLLHDAARHAQRQLEREPVTIEKP